MTTELWVPGYLAASYLYGWLLWRFVLWHDGERAESMPWPDRRGVRVWFAISPLAVPNLCLTVVAIVFVVGNAFRSYRPLNRSWAFVCRAGDTLFRWLGF
jgi:hypothetical protein